ncbi:ATP-dependent DNA helicase RecQ [Halobacillus andaensis]|uniref:ATP-dependent DNA helicase RecQ n=1 Tax=Halobacillus andaensis TaxID=1176239 RepID=A0A917AY96_HALAA|nr:RecQ family ATP-dependent DNA helicase [Halobacillus andaensis]MBP2003236.1 ATP-dependent DNA helicase RecQ [Halobacillus andaensis]GGF09130.1 ATP-dependent DNA helicase RecQ [Halobacillus andaensis]
MGSPHLLDHLKQHFGYSSFREGQQEIIEDVLDGKDVLGILPTGVGKSLCFQLPSLLQKGTTIVVSPLISLMVDQVKQLKAKGFKSVIALNSFMEPKERKAVFQSLNNYRLIYLSPEMLQNRIITQELKKLYVELFVIDEAHCISQWGHEFRTDYLKLSQATKEFGDPVILALSATATPEVQDDIKRQLNKPDMVPHIYRMDKPNMSFAVEDVLYHQEKVERIKSIVSNKPAPTMIYFSSRQAAEQVAVELTVALDQRIAFYHGGMENMDRLLVQQQFMKDELDVICCTSAFGMGVDKPNIRRVIHYHFPTQIESFIQEIGRAGRDGKPCASLVLHTPSDQVLPQMLLEKELPQEEDVDRLIRWMEQKDELQVDEEMAEILQLSESQWNFLKYHLEHHHVVSNRTIQRNIDLTGLRAKISQRLKERWLYKNRKYKQMVNWIHCSGCRRKQLYAPFQKEISKPMVMCCDYCGFSIDDLEIKEARVESGDAIENWQDRLRTLFLQETTYDKT